MTEEKWRPIFAKKLRYMLHKRNMTQAEFADRLGLSKGIVSMYMTGKRNPSLNVLFDISEALCCDFDWLISSKE